MIITLLSDFGMQDFSPAIVKGVLWQELPDARFVDLSHDVMPHHLLQCCYFLKSSYANFPEKTIHLSLFDFFQPLLLTAVDGRFIISADNGLLPLAFGNRLQQVYAIETAPDANFVERIRAIAVFLKRWASRNFSLDELKTTECTAAPAPFEPYATEDAITCQVIHVDRFGNVVLNLREDFFNEQRNGRNFSIEFSRHSEIHQIHKNYAEVPEGEKLCLFNAGGFMEIAVNKGSAAQLFGLSLKRPEHLVYNRVVIHFD